MKQTLKYILEQLIQMRKFAEDKHSITIALASGVVVFYAGFIQSDESFVLVLSSLSIIFSLIAILFSFFALMARRVSTQDNNKTKKGNLVDYKSIAEFNIENYLLAMRKQYLFPNTYNFDDFDRDLASQIISTAKVIKRKFLYFNISLVFLASSIFLGVIVVCIIGGI